MKPVVLAIMLLVGMARSGPLQAMPAQQKSPKHETEFVQVSEDRKQFVFAHSGGKFTPWGFNYDHDSSDRLLEDYWETEWPAVERHFEQMKALGANTVRIHLQLSKFMSSPRQPNRTSLRRLGRLVGLAEKRGLYLDITGLGCYKKEDTPKWYNDLDEQPRWDVQARFWEAVASVCRRSPAVFCYDLMNEPIVSEDKKGRDWTPGAFGNRYFVQRLTLDFAGRSQEQIAQAWVEKMVHAIRKHDPQHLITIGVIPWALTWPGARDVFYSKAVSQNLDFVSVHFYPKHAELEKALAALQVYGIDKTIVIEEMFPLNCSVPELDEFIEGSKNFVTGLLGFYWGKMPAEYRQMKGSLGDTLAMNWLEYFVKKTPEILSPSARRL